VSAPQNARRPIVHVRACPTLPPAQVAPSTEVAYIPAEDERDTHPPGPIVMGVRLGWVVSHMQKGTQW
jgi:hypothetical protein